MHLTYDKKRHSHRPALSLFKVCFTALMAAILTSGCAWLTYHEIPGDLSDHTDLALSPNGKRLLLSWREYSGKLQTRLLELDGAQIKSVSFPTLPDDTITIAFAKSDAHLLVTTWDQKISRLLKINVDNNDIETLYQSPKIIRLPLEVKEQNYVFLETYDEKNHFSRWQRLDHGQKSLLNSMSYNMIAPINVLGEALYLIEPTNTFRAIHGTLPAGLNEQIEKDTFYVVCADKYPLSCLQSKLYFGRDGSYSKLEINNAGQRCQIAGNWIDVRHDQISRDGSTVVFHAAISKHFGARSLYVVQNTNSQCEAQALDIKGMR